MPDWAAVARELVRAIDQSVALLLPKGAAVFVDWRGQPYMGSVQPILPEYSPDIILLSKTSAPLAPGLYEALVQEAPHFVRLAAGDGLDLEGRLHVLRRVENALHVMTPEQLAYVHDHRMLISELNTGQVTMHCQAIRYQGGAVWDEGRN